MTTAGISLTDAKAFALTGAEGVCEVSNIEIGNFIWNDANQNGRQDPGEEPLEGVKVTLKNSSGTPIATATTDANGNYIFSNAAKTNTNSLIYNLTALTPLTDYILSVDGIDGQTPLGGLGVTTTNITSNGEDQRDNDATVSGNNAEISFTTKASGANDHSLDFGFSQVICTLTLKPTVSGCYLVGNQSKATVSVEVAWDGAPAGDSILVTGPAGSVPATRYVKVGTIPVGYTGADGFTFSTNQFIVSPQVVTFEIPANGTTGLSVSAAFTNHTTCSATSITFNAPAACPQTVCTTGNLGGTVFYDYNANGTKEAGETRGLGGIEIKAYDCNGNLAGTTQTDVYGKYTLAIPANAYPVRVEFGSLPAFAGQGTPNGTDGRTTVQFVSSANCNVDLGVLNPNDYCQSNPQVITPCYINGNPLASGSPSATMDALVSFAYGAHRCKRPLQNYLVGYGQSGRQLVGRSV